MAFAVKKKFYPVGKTVRIVFEPVFPYTISDGAEYLVLVAPFGGIKTYALAKQGKSVPAEVRERFYEKKPPVRTDRGLEYELVFPQEDRYKLYLQQDGKVIESTEVCALDDDLYGTLPLKGDMHIHSYCSDGSESPEYMGAFCRRRGYDFISVTDHGLFAPSEKARDYFEKRDTDFFVIPGEEVHSPGNDVHILNIGGRTSVNKWAREEHTDEYEALVRRELENIPGQMDEKTRYMAAASQVMFDKIRAEGGVSVLNHPCWIVWHGLNESEDLTEYLMENVRFDALELIAGGARDEGIFLQLAAYKNWPELPILGNSDCHSSIYTSLKIGTYTIVFAREATAEGVKEAIRAGRCAAYRDDRFYGPYRFVKLAYFLRAQVYGAHDSMCEDEGDYLVKCVLGSESRQDEFLKNAFLENYEKKHADTVDYYKGLYY